MFDMIDRWRHRHGFGVHSPFAFRIVTEAIRRQTRYRYYEEEAIEASSSLSAADKAHELRRIRLRNILGEEADSLTYIECPDESVLDRLRSSLTNSGGLLLLGRDYAVAIPRPGMAFQCYTV